jgi:hypothetical protein
LACISEKLAAKSAFSLFSIESHINQNNEEQNYSTINSKIQPLLISIDKN